MKYLLFILLLVGCGPSFYSFSRHRDITGSYEHSPCFYNTIASELNSTTLYSVVNYITFYDDGSGIEDESMYSDASCSNLVQHGTFPFKWATEFNVGKTDVYQLDFTNDYGPKLYASAYVVEAGLYMDTNPSLSLPDSNDSEIKRFESDPVLNGMFVRRSGN